MAKIEVICTNCNKTVSVDNEKDANVCPICNEPFVTEKAVALYNNQHKTFAVQTVNETATKQKKERHRKESIIKALKMIGKTFLFVLECIGYLFYVIFFIWLFVDLTDGIKKK